MRREATDKMLAGASVANLRFHSHCSLTPCLFSPPRTPMKQRTLRE
jgi:hypothetical protein